MATNEESEVLSIRLTAEELVVVYELTTESPAQVPIADLLPDLGEEELQFARQYARRSLLARDLIEADGEAGYTLHPLLYGLAGARLLADSTTFLMSQADTGEMDRIEFQRYGEEIFLAHSETTDGLHEFQLFADEAAFRRGLLRALRVTGEKAAKCPAGELSQEELGRILGIARHGKAEAVLEALLDTPLPAKTARALASSLNPPFVIKTVTILNRDNGDEQELVFLESSGGLWHVHANPSGASESEVAVIPLRAAEAEEKVKSFLGGG